MQEPLIGRRIAHLSIGSLLGRGAMGEVYQGYDDRDSRPVAIKVIHGRRRLDTSERVRFLRQSRDLARLQHPGICRVFDWIETPKADLLVVELIEGRTLTDCSELLSPVDRLQVALKIAEAMEAAHREGVLHLDLQPSHVMITPRNGVKVLNFGIAGLRERRDDRQPARTPPGPEMPRQETLYISPEQARGESPTAASDVFSLGVVLQELFTGLPAYPDVPEPALRQLAAEGRTRPPEDLDPHLALLLHDLQSLDPMARPSIGEAVDRLRKLFGRPLRKRLRRQATVFGAIFSVLLATALAIGYQLAGQPRLLPAGSRGRILLMPFVNQTGDPRLGWTEQGLSAIVARSLERVDGVDVVLASDLRRAALTTLQKPVEELHLGEIRRLASLLGAELSLQVTVLRHRERFVLQYQPVTPTGLRRTRRVDGNDLFDAARSLARRLSQRLAPASRPAALDEHLSGDPLVDQLYGMALDHLGREQFEVARDFLAVTSAIAPRLTPALLDLAACSQRLSQWAESERIANDVLRSDQVGRDPRLVATAMELLSAAALAKGDSQNASQFARRSEALAQMAGDLDLQAAALQQASTADLAAGDLPAARQHLLRELELRQRLADRFGEAPLLFQIGAITGEDETQIDEALAFLKQALAVAKESSARELEAHVVNRMGLLLLSVGKNGAAIDSFREALDVFQHLDDRPAALLILDNLATVELARDNCAGAIPWLEALESEAGSFGDYERRTEAALDLSICSIRQAQPESAETHLAIAAAGLPADWRIPYLTGRIALLRGDRSAASTSFLEARALAGAEELPELDDEISTLRESEPPRSAAPQRPSTTAPPTATGGSPGR